MSGQPLVLPMPDVSATHRGSRHPGRVTRHAREQHKRPGHGLCDLAFAGAAFGIRSRDLRHHEVVRDRDELCHAITSDPVFADQSTDHSPAARTLCCTVHRRPRSPCAPRPLGRAMNRPTSSVATPWSHGLSRSHTRDRSPSSAVFAPTRLTPTSTAAHAAATAAQRNEASLRLGRDSRRLIDACGLRYVNVEQFEQVGGDDPEALPSRRTVHGYRPRLARSYPVVRLRDSTRFAVSRSTAAGSASNSSHGSAHGTHRHAW